MLMKKKGYSLGGDIRLLSSCPLCGEKYGRDAASIIEERKNAFLIHVQCSKCKSSIVSSMTLGQLGTSSMGLITDLTSQDVSKFRKMNPIDADEVLDVHHGLRSGNIVA